MAVLHTAGLVFGEIFVTGCYIFRGRALAPSLLGFWLSFGPAGFGESREFMKVGEDTTNDPARRRMPWRRWCAKLVLSALVALGACATPPEPAPGGKLPNAAAAPLAQSTNVIYVMPVQGLENPLRLVLADAVAASLRDAERPAILADGVNNQGPTIVPSIDRVRERGSVVWVTTRWKLRAPYGTMVAERQREMVIDKRLWQQKSVETVNLIIDDAMPAVAAMVHDYVGPLNTADASETPDADDPGRMGMAPKPATTAPAPSSPPVLRAQTDGKPILGRTDPTETLPAQVGLPAPPEPAENLVLDLPQIAETDAVPLPGRAGGGPAPPASRPPMVLAPARSPAPPAASGEPMPARGAETAMAKAAAPPFPSSASQSAPPMSAPPARDPAPLSAPPPPETMAGIKPSPRDTPVRWGKPSFLVRAVEGAPGDGNRALVTAITAALRGKDLTVTEDPRQAGYEVVGKVDVGPAVNGRQRARITWAVNTMGGQEVGKAVQENVVAAGSLDSSWGQVAVLVSSAAANGIQQLFEAPRPKYTPVGAVPEFPKIPSLPRVPGRALPPPS